MRRYEAGAGQYRLGYFNPRTREGCDIEQPGMEVSLREDFNPRTREGCDGCTGDGTAHRLYFNPRTREGCDPSSVPGPAGQASYFNPRTREGCDPLDLTTTVNCCQFQSTHP